MLYKVIFLIFLVIISCTNLQQNTKTQILGGECVKKVNRLFKNDKEISTQNILGSIHKIYNRRLYENVAHIIYNYDDKGVRKKLEVKWDNRKTSFKPILSMIKTDFEESLPDNVANLSELTSKLKKYSILYKQSFYYLGHKKLYLTFDENRLSSMYLGRDFSCRFEEKKVECHCSRYFR